MSSIIRARNGDMVVSFRWWSAEQSPARRHQQNTPIRHHPDFTTPALGDSRSVQRQILLVWTAPGDIECTRMRSCVDLKQRRPFVEQISRIGMDTSKHVFQLHGVNVAGITVLREKLRRKEMVAFFQTLPPTVIGIEACGASHHLARLLSSFGHTVKLIAPQLVKPYVKRGKNDAADAEALCEAMSRPTMRFVPVKTAEQQAALMLVGVRDRLIRNRTQLSNAIRGYAAEFGLTAAKGKAHLLPLLERIHADESLPVLAHKLFAIQAKEYEPLQAQIDEVDAKLADWHRADECSLRHIVAWRPVLVAGVWVATHIGGFIHHLGTTPSCRSNTMPNTAITSPSPGIGLRTGLSMTLP